MVRLHALEYAANGITYGITIEGCFEEAHAHAMRLGLTYLGEVAEQIEAADELVEGQKE